MSFEIGKSAGSYEIIDVLSTSKTGVAYKVRNLLAQRLEVLKILPNNLQEDPERVARFLREMKVHARLQHPNIVSFYNAMEIERKLVMTTELVEGTTLAQRLEIEPIPWKAAVDYSGQILSALSYAHSQAVIHRNITPENIVVTPEGKVKLTGFELAAVATDPRLTQLGAVVGELRYISPEQVQGVSGLDARTDIYSLGVVLYEALTGSVPFESKSQFEIMLAHVKTTPSPPSEVNPDVPKEFDPVVLTALSKEPSQRWQTADEFREAIEKVAEVLERAGEPAHVDVSELFKPQRIIFVPVPQTTPSDLVPEPAQRNVRTARAWGFPEAFVAGIFALIMTALMLVAFLVMHKP